MAKRQWVNMKTFFALVFSFGLAVAVASGQAPGQVVKAKVTMASPEARPNSVLRAAVVVEVLPGYHINEHHPSLDYLIPTDVKLEPSKQVTVQDITYPKGELKKFAFSDGLLSVYEGTLRVDVALALDRKALPGNYELKGQLAYQACNDHACLPPASAPLLFSFKVVRRAASARRAK
jgi:DsbC/DsbD-like thiol-disulfide interchange protein